MSKVTRLPGRPRPQAEALADYDRKRREWINSRAQPATAALLADFVFPPAELAHRWRIQLDCGHIREVYTGGKDQPPSGAAWHGDVFTALPGEYFCREQGCKREPPVRDITSWDSRDGEEPPGPEEPPEWWTHGPELWLRTPSEPRARWAVTLSCGHHDDQLTPLAWQPADGITRRPPADDAEWARRQEALDVVVALDDEYARRYVIEDHPDPVPFMPCYTCMVTRKITAEEYVRPLGAPPRPPRRPRKEPAARAVLQRRLREAERQAADLRGQLAALDSDEPEP